MSLPVITAAGDPYTIGHTIGSAISDAVQRVTVLSDEFIETEQKWRGSDYVLKMMALTEEVFPEYMLELKGMSDGMGIDLDRAFLWNCRGDLRWPDDVSPAVAAGLTEGCTSLLIPGRDKAPDIIAHNEDGTAEFHGACFWLKVTPDTGPVFESFLYPGMIAGHTMGFNHAGIVQTINNIRVHDLKPGLPRHFICRAILSSTTLDGALELLKRNDRASGFHHNLGSATEGRLVSVEAPASGCVITTIIGTPTAHANHLITPELKERPQSITASSAVRQVRADDLLKQGILDASGPTGVLFDAKSGSEILRSPKDGGDDYGKTLATGIFELSPSRVSVTVHDGPNSKNTYTTSVNL